MPVVRLSPNRQDPGQDPSQAFNFPTSLDRTTTSLVAKVYGIMISVRYRFDPEFVALTVDYTRTFVLYRVTGQVGTIECQFTQASLLL